MRNSSDGARQVNWIAVVPYAVLAALYIIMVLMQPKLLSPYWIGLKTNDAFSLILVSIGQTLILINGGIDLSVGGVICLTNCIAALYMKDNPASIFGVSLGVLALGAAIGLLNGFAISKSKLQPFIVTLASWSIWGGFALLLLPTDGGAAPKSFIAALLWRPAGVSISIFAIVALALVWFYVRQTFFGLALFSVGSNEKSASLNGIKVDRTKMQVYALSGLLAAAAGLYRTAQVASGSPQAGNNFIMPSVVAAVIGGTSLAGGRGGIVGSIAGALVLRLISDVLVLMGVSSYWSTLFQGMLLIFAVILGSVSNITKRKELDL
jgi:ribose transport system permease protein